MIADRKGAAGRPLGPPCLGWRGDRRKAADRPHSRQ